MKILCDISVKSKFSPARKNPLSDEEIALGNESPLGYSRRSFRTMKASKVHRD
jgi:hypothetical protein